MWQNHDQTNSNACGLIAKKIRTLKCVGKLWIPAALCMGWVGGLELINYKVGNKGNQDGL